jgi:hypothetical protein
MHDQRRKTFQEILREEAPRNAWRLETKARSASWLAKLEPQHCSALYSVKHAALRQLFLLPRHAPVIRDAWTTDRGFLLSVQLQSTGSMLHVPFDALRVTTQQAHGLWVARRARGRRWQTPPVPSRPALGSDVFRPARSAR